MSVQSAQSVTVSFDVHNPATGAAANYSSATGTLIVNGTDDAAVVSLTNVATGRYKAAVTLPALTRGDRVEMNIAYTVGGVSGNAIIWRDYADEVLSTSAQTTASAIRTAVGLATANLDTQLAGISVGSTGLTASGVWSYGQRTLTDQRTFLVPTLQRKHRQVVQGDDYSATARALYVLASDGGEWPTDLSLYTWSAVLTKDPDNDNTGTASLTVTPVAVTSTGASRYLRVPLTSAQTGALALGAYNYDVQGTKSGEKWTVETGTLDVAEDYTP